MLSYISFSLWVIKRISIHAHVLEQILFYVIYFWTLSFNFVFMCPKNMLMLKSGKGDQICQICLDLHHLHTICTYFLGEVPQTSLFSPKIHALKYASLHSAYVALFHFPKLVLLKKKFGHPRTIGCRSLKLSGRSAFKKRLFTWFWIMKYLYCE